MYLSPVTLAAFRDEFIKIAGSGSDILARRAAESWDKARRSADKAPLRATAQRAAKSWDKARKAADKKGFWSSLLG